MISVKQREKNTPTPSFAMMNHSLNIVIVNIHCMLEDAKQQKQCVNMIESI